MKNLTRVLYKMKINTFVEFIKPKLYADINLNNSKEYSDVDNHKLKFG
jgi:hypothetical protein